jgi:hypothetical protein
MENQTNHEHHSSHNTIKSKLISNPWQISAIVLGIVTLILIFMLTAGSSVTGNSVSSTEAGEKLISFINSQGQGIATLVSSEKEGSLYKVTVNYNGEEIPVYITLDGKNLITTPISLDSSGSQPANQPSENNQPSQQDAPKSDKPKVELFVMTHCPYGTQSEKGIIPTIEVLGSKVDFDVRFVHYFMHGDKEEKETYNQVCIREEQNEKFLPYLECFLASTGSEDDAKKCLDAVKIDQSKLNTCISSGKGKEYYEVDKKLSNSYGVQGSPTLVINGVEANSGRDSLSYLKTICGAFNNAPTTECTKQLSGSAPSPGFGTASSASGGSASSSGGCASA